MGITISQKEISLDLQNQGFTNTIYSQQGDTDSRKLVVSLFDDGEEYIISSSSTVYLEGTRADDAVVHRKVDSISDNTVTVLFKNEELCVKGIAKYKISIYGNDGSILSSVPFKIKVYENIYNDEGIIATPEYSELQKILEDVSELEDNINKSEASRVESENKRNESESLRTESEEARKTAENQRSTAEEIRISSENERVENEKNRTKEFAEMKKSADGAENLNIESISSDENYQVKITNRNGEQNTSPNLLNKLQIGTVESGEYDENASATITGKFGEQKLNLRLPIGKPFKISKTYSSIDAMNKNISADLNLYEFCMIDTGNVEDEDTAKLYMRDVDGAHYITDLSGVQGIQGVKGETGETPQLTIGSVTTGNPGTNASVTITGTKENPIINFVIPRGEKGTFNNVSASSIPYNDETDTKSVKDVVDSLQTAIDDIEIGGRNLLLNSSFELPGNLNWIGLSDYSYITKEGRNGGYCAKQIGKLNENNPLTNSVSLKVKANDVFTFSGWYKVQDYVSGTTNNYVRPYIEYHKSNGEWLGETEILSISPDATDWTYVKASFKVPNISTIDHMIFILYARDYTGIIWWDDIKLENGNKATPWTPAIEDTESEIQAVDNKLTTNMLKPTLGTTTQNGVTYTNNGDGTYTLNGTASSTVYLDLCGFTIKSGITYRMCGCPSGYEYGDLRLETNIDPWYHDSGNGVTFSRNSDQSVNIRIFIREGVTVSNIIFKPMITTNLNATYDDFVPYTGSTGKLNSDVAELNKTVNTLKKSVSDGKTKVANAITDKGVETATDATFDVMAENISKIETGGGELHGATLAVSTTDSVLFGQTVTLTFNGASVGSTMFADNGTCSFVVQNPGTYTITCGEAHKDVTVTGDNVVNKTVISVELFILKIVAFADGTDEEIAAMVNAHYNDKINLSDYWAVGDTRSVSLSAMSSDYVRESHRAQTVQFVIGDFEHDDLVASINGHTKAAITLLQKNCLMDATSSSNSNNGSNDTETGQMNSSDTNSGGWKNCNRRTWCNNVYYNALPSAWKSMVKTVNKKSGTGSGSSSGTETTQDKIFLAAEIEIFGSTTYSVSGEGAQYQYYKNATANRYKMPKWDSSYVSQWYWERSPRSGNSAHFCYVSYNGSASSYIAFGAYGVAPCLCI